jgi:uncharacterized protein YbjT (DUF2867 family)
MPARWESPVVRQSEIVHRKFMNVLVTGGTGFVGRELVRQLRNAGHRLHLLVREAESSRARDLAAQLGVKLVSGNVRDVDVLAKACAGMDAVVHLVGIISEVGDQTFDNIHVRGTRNLVFAAQDAGVRRFLHMSALGTRPNARSRYHQSKWAGEEFVRQSGLAWTVFRPSIIYGPGDGFVNLFARMARYLPAVPVIGGGQARYQPVSVKSVGTAVVKSLVDPQAVGEVYELCGPETLTLDEMVDQILEVMNRRRMKVHVPLGLARWQASLLESVFPRLLRRPSPFTRDQILMLGEDNVGDGRKAKEQFGLKLDSFKEGIAAYLK